MREGIGDRIGSKRWVDDDGNNFLRYNIGRSSLLVTGDIDGIGIASAEEVTDRRTYTATFRVSSSSGHVFTLEDGQEYTTMPGDTLNLALPVSPLTKQPRPYEYILRAQNIKSRIKETKGLARGGRVRVNTTSAWIPPNYFVSSMAGGLVDEDWANVLGPKEPFEGFKPIKKKKEKEITPEEMEKKLTEIGKRKITFD